MRKRTLAGLFAFTAILSTACGGGGSGSQEARGSDLTGTIRIDGSSTVFPIAEAVSEEFQLENSGVQAPVGQSGTGGGFKKFCNGETQISTASRPIKTEEKQACTAKQIEAVELKVAIDGLSVVVNPKNTFAKCLTVAELKKMWEPDSTVKTWKDVKDSFPANPIKLYGPGPDSGTFDYFTDEINGEEGASRKDYTPSEDDNILVQGIKNEANALGYFGYSYFEASKNDLKALEVDGGSGCVAPTRRTIEDGTYTPLSRPLFIYVGKAALAKPEVKAYVEFFLANVSELVADVGYVALPDEELAASNSAFEGAAGG